MGMDSGDSNKFSEASRAKRSRNAKKQNRSNGRFSEGPINIPKPPTVNLINLRDKVNEFDAKKKQGYRTLEDRRHIAYVGSIPEALHSLVSDEDEIVRCWVGENPNTGLETLEILSNDKSWMVRAGVAGNKNISQDLIKKLSKDKNRTFVRSTIFGNPKTPLSVLQAASHRSLRTFFDGCRTEIANHPNASPELLDRLSRTSRGPFSFVRLNVAANENTSPNTLAYLIKHSGSYVRENVATNKNIDEATLERLVYDRKNIVRLATLINPNITLRLLEILYKDKDAKVRDKAIVLARKFI